MSDVGEDDHYEDDDGYFYVEDSYGVADDLAEHAVASPPWAWYEEEADQEFDPYCYWNDVEYDSDGFHDDIGKATLAKRAPEAPKSGRKRKADTISATTRKRQKIGLAAIRTKDNGNITPTQNISWMPRDVRGDIETPGRNLRRADKDTPFALLPDWKQKAARMEGPNVKSRTCKNHVSSEVQVSNMTEQVGDEQDSGGFEADAIQAAIQQRLRDLPEDMDKDMLAQIALQMLSGEGDSEGMVGKLAASLLDKASGESDESGVGQWLTEQGVTLTDADEKDNFPIAEKAPERSQLDSPVVKPALPEEPLTPPESHTGSSGNRHRTNS